jgi:ATP-dependent Lon protease
MADTTETQETGARVLPVLPLTTGVVLPQMVVTLALETPEARAAWAAASGAVASGAEGELVLLPLVNGRYARVGTIGSVETSGELRGGVPALIVRGLRRAVIGVGVPGSGDTLWVQVDPVADGGEPTAHANELAREFRVVVEAILEHRGAGRLTELFQNVNDPSALADTAGYWPDLSIERKVELLETIDVEERLTKALGWARDQLGELELKERIRTDVAEGMEKTQREFLLRQQLAAIRKELGESGEAGDLIEEYHQKLADRVLPDAVRQAVDRELDRLERTPEQSPEHGWIRAWLDTIVELPWGQRSDDRLDVDAARQVLDADHTGLSDVKDRIVEYLAVRKLRTERAESETETLDITDTTATAPTTTTAVRGDGLILALVGPPGVGKTSLGESVARAMGRRFVRVALGGVRDEAEIRGHRRTYVGAMPGRLVRAIREAGTINPVVLLDEVDKLGADWRGDPSSALLEVLDPAQNHTFRDHYLDVDLDLSDVLFLATANTAETIPGPLLDRMEVVRLDGYTEDEKVDIARDHLWPRLLTRHALKPDEVVITEAAIRSVIADYTREAGVRSLERGLATLLRKAAVRVASGGEVPLTVDEAKVREWLGRPRFFAEVAERTSVPGVATGLAVTGAGGDVLFVEAGAMAGEGGLTITGQLGDVMRESAEIALSYVRSHAAALGISADAFDKRRFHVHVPAGAVPKDGPSAGVTMTTALVSLLTGRSVRANVGMTGEVTLQGKVLPIGGVKQKVLAAHRAGLTDVILPARNGPDLDDVPEAVRQVMSFHLANDISDVLSVALELDTQQQAA